MLRILGDEERLRHLRNSKALETLGVNRDVVLREVLQALVKVPQTQDKANDTTAMVMGAGTISGVRAAISSLTLGTARPAPAGRIGLGRRDHLNEVRPN